MKMTILSLIEWQKRFGTEKDCAKALEKVRWSNGSQCPACGSQIYCLIETRKLYQCSNCRHKLPVTVDFLFHATKASLNKWFREPELPLRLLKACLVHVPAKIAEFH